MKDRTIKLLGEKLEEEQTRNNILQKQIQELSIVHHKYNSRLETTDLVLHKVMNMESSEELSNIANTLSEWSKSYSKEIESAITNKKTLPSTNVPSIDLLLEQLQNNAILEFIDFTLKIDCSVNILIDTCISKNNLETLVGDHIKDAIIATNLTNNPNKCIHSTFEINDNAYEFSIYDSGIPFDIDTLAKLGLEPVTTHKETGGNGFGFFNTFKILDECKASLHIIELDFKNSNFSKCIKFRFDNKKQYVIHSSRSKEISEKDISNRIILENL
ncbi:MAG: hypothetical protein FWC68_02570 [Oscillospiraceae bacterium]|nr:hypothetical protein [Oscillospiraceae bacterium]